MSEPDRVPLLLVGATGLIGTAVIAATAARADIKLAALARREVSLPAGARLEMLVADPADWPAAIARARPVTLVIALGTTIAAVGGDRQAFRAVDHDLVLDVARAARAAGTRQVILVSSVGADPDARNFYLSVKGETEAAVNHMGFSRLDILRPGLLRGHRSGPPRPAERLGQIIAPLIDPLLRGGLARYRSVRARDVATAILALAGQQGRGRHVHYTPDIHSLAHHGLT
ncbi:NAD(P)H-binding protein [Novosphingobium sp. Fuku2-ISO-50]|uniref:NAD(P)H-binding protein n=1 Tax=Novosphingobium sp. Fuku2-ISO-50 TaxID=1739114 RepID=UPI00076C42A2|nr:NAD(P)H-binding protein [Novosphingobium sp. Fuku2-ISO-50]KUR77918.1 nucleoside-diphosphate sugar epimerase [Novosphingobium sp. Fuku2-ISO-50]